MAERGLQLPKSDYDRRRVLRFLPDCPFPDRRTGPALLCAFTTILTQPPTDPFYDEPVTSIHRIRGRGKGNKAMLGPVGARPEEGEQQKAIMFGEWEEVFSGGVLHVTEGVEDALGVLGEGRDPGKRHRPVWALSSKGLMKSMPIISRLRTIHIWADNDASGEGLEAAKILGERYADAGVAPVIHMLKQVGADYAD